MFKFRSKKKDQTEEDLALVAVPTDHEGKPVTQARLFASVFQRNAAREMITLVGRVRSRSDMVARLALGASIPHQISYLLALILPYLEWRSAPGIIGALGAFAIVFAAPIVNDLTILSAIEIVGGKAVARGDKKAAIWKMLLPVLASGFVNFVAPAPFLLKGLSAFMVLMVPVVVTFRFVRADFVAMEEAETGVARSLDEAAARREQESADRAAKEEEEKNAQRPRVTRAQAAANKAKAERLAESNPNMSIAMLVRETGVSRPTAKKILGSESVATARMMAELAKQPSNAPTSPAVVPRGRRK